MMRRKIFSITAKPLALFMLLTAIGLVISHLHNVTWLVIVLLIFVIMESFILGMLYISKPFFKYLHDNKDKLK